MVTKGDHTVSQQGSSPIIAKIKSPFRPFSYQGKQTEYASLAFIIRTERYNDIFKGGLQRECPEYTGQCP